MSKPNSSFQQANQKAIPSGESVPKPISPTSQPELPQATQEFQPTATALTVDLKLASPAVSLTPLQPPANFELAEYSMLAAEFLKGLHLRGKLLPLLREATAEQLLLQHAQAAEIRISPQELQSAADAFRQQNSLSSASDMEAWLGREHLTIAHFEDALHRDLLVSKLRDYVTRGRIASHFDADPSRYDQAHLRQLVVRQKDLAHTLREQLNQPSSNFAEIAHDYSIDQTRQDQDSDLKVVFRYHTPQEITEKIFSAKPGDIAGPVEIASNFHLFQVENIKPAELDDFTVESIRSELFNNWLSEQLHSAKIDPQLLKLIL